MGYILHWNLASSSVESIFLQGQYLCFPCVESIKKVTMVCWNSRVITLLKPHILFSFSCLVYDRSKLLSRTKCSPKDFFSDSVTGPKALRVEENLLYLAQTAILAVSVKRVQVVSYYEKICRVKEVWSFSALLLKGNDLPYHILVIYLWWFSAVELPGLGNPMWEHVTTQLDS